MNGSELITQIGPSAGAVVIVVLIFLKHMAGRDKVIREMARECHEVQERSTNALIDNAKIQGECIGVIREVSQLLRRMNHCPACQEEHTATPP